MGGRGQQVEVGPREGWAFENHDVVGAPRTFSASGRLQVRKVTAGVAGAQHLGQD